MRDQGCCNEAMPFSGFVSSFLLGMWSRLTVYITFQNPSTCVWIFGFYILFSFYFFFLEEEQVSLNVMIRLIKYRLIEVHFGSHEQLHSISQY